ncbi:MAG: hypothetical protein QG597_3471 [Actinomycetota bacterium]|nr:hypothetical protein [Actinomycetota bacterium]
MVTPCNPMSADGYIGGSTIDQASLGHSIENRVAEFKTVTDAKYGGAPPPGEGDVHGRRDRADAVGSSRTSPLLPIRRIAWMKHSGSSQLSDRKDQ